MSDGDWHVLPNNDAVAHEDRDDCLCGPKVEPVLRDDGSCGWLIIHHSLDDREARE